MLTSLLDVRSNSYLNLSDGVLPSQNQVKLFAPTISRRDCFPNAIILKLPAICILSEEEAYVQQWAR